MTEYIKREDAIKALGEEPYVWSDTDVEIAEHAQWVSDVKAIEAVPSANVVERKKGKWIQENNCYHRCSVCGDHFPALLRISGISKEKNFCPNCGADMRPKDK